MSPAAGVGGQNCPQLRTTGLGGSRSLECPPPSLLPAHMLCLSLLSFETSSAKPFPVLQVRVHSTLTCAPRTHGHLVLTVRMYQVMLLLPACLPSHPIVSSSKTESILQRWIEVLWPENSWQLVGRGPCLRKRVYIVNAKIGLWKGTVQVGGGEANPSLVPLCFLSCWAPMCSMHSSVCSLSGQMLVDCSSTSGILNLKTHAIVSKYGNYFNTA